MSLWPFILGFVVFLMILILILFFKKLYTPTTGEKIQEYEHPQKALLVIDMQKDYTGESKDKPPIYLDTEEKINTINRMIDLAVQQNMKILYVCQVFDNNFILRNLVKRTIEGLPGTELDSRINKVSENEFIKKRSDSFSNPQLEEFLIKNQVNQLYLVGLDADFCVYFTAMGALNRGYKVSIVKDGILARKDLNKTLQKYKEKGIYIPSSHPFHL